MLKQYMTPVAAIVAHELNMFAHLEAVMDKWDGKLDVDANTVRDIRERSDGASKIVSDLNLNMTGQKTRMLAHCLAHDITEVETLRNRIREVRETMIQELSSINFLRVTDDMEAYLDKSNAFGEAVSLAFPGSVEDIAEAHQCFAFGRYTAGMFHLGRAMELAVRRLAKKMRIGIKRDWQSYLTAMNEKIAKMPFKTPEQKAKRAPFAEAAAYLLHFKEAWRNPTMHPKKTYTRDEALEVINGAGAFLRYVSREIFKAKAAP
jgi:HEPN domain-containing protein